MSNPNPSESNSVAESSESFEDILSQYEKTHSRKKEDGGKQLEATVIAVSANPSSLILVSRPKASCRWRCSKARARP